MELKLNQVAQSKILQDTTLTVQSGVYSYDTFETIIEDLKNEFGTKGFELVAVEPVKVTIRQYFDPKPQPVTEDPTEAIEVD